MSTLISILKDNWEWRGQVWRLALFELKKQSRGAVGGYAWYFIRPLIYIFCFWFALEIGLKAGRSAPGDAPYILWLTAGIIPWFFMRDMLGSGLDVFHKFSYLVKKVKFPLCAISTIYSTSKMLVQLMLQVLLLLVYFVCGQGFDLYLLQIPFLIVLMYLFWNFVSMLFSPLCAMSKDMRNFMSVLGTPFFWLSGVLFDVKSIGSSLIQNVLYFNPITFFVSGFRDALYMKQWIWDDPKACICFALVFVVTLVVALVVYKRTHKEIADVL